MPNIFKQNFMVFSTQKRTIKKFLIFSQNNGLTSLEKSTFATIEDRCVFSYSVEILVFYTKTSPNIINLSVFFFQPKTKLLNFFYFLAEIMALNPLEKIQ